MASLRVHHWTSIHPIRLQPPTYKAFMPRSAIRADRTTPNRPYKRNGGWLLNANENCAIITRSSSITAVGVLTSSKPKQELTFTGVMAEMSSTQSDRSMSPSSVSEEGRRDLLARQHRALYGGSANNFLPQGGFGDDSAISREPGLQGPGTGTNGARGTSPRSTDPFAAGQSTNHQSAASNERTSSSLPNSEAGRVEASSSPASGGPSMHLGSIDASMEPPSARSGSPVEGGSPNHRVAKLHAAPIGSEKVSAGSRMAQQQHQHQPASSSQQQQPSQSSIMQQSNPAPSQTITKRSTTPLTSPLNSFGLSASEQATHNERSGSTSSNPSNGSKETGSAMGAWGSGNGVWGSNKIGPASVWG